MAAWRSATWRCCGTSPDLFGPVATTATVWRVLDAVDEPLLDRVKVARAGMVMPGLVIDLDATLVACHSEKQRAAATYQHGYGYHPFARLVDNTGGEPRPVDESGLPAAQAAELTGLLPGLSAAGWPEGMRVLVRRERPHPGAQISVFEAHDGWRYQAFATDIPHGQLAFLEARHRAHARVEDRIRTAKQAGLGRFPSREFAINAVWLQLALTAADLIAWTQTILFTGELAKAELKLLRYRLLHTAAQIIRRGRRTFVKIAAGWPWADDLAAAFTRLAGIRQPLLA
jgi:hypothetical protein